MSYLSVCVCLPHVGMRDYQVCMACPHSSIVPRRREDSARIDPNGVVEARRRIGQNTRATLKSSTLLDLAWRAGHSLILARHKDRKTGEREAKTRGQTQGLGARLAKGPARPVIALADRNGSGYELL